MPTSIQVKDFISKTKVFLRPDMDVLEAIHTLLEKDVPGAPVLDDLGNLVGWVSEKDCLQAALTASYHEEFGGRVDEFMSSEVQSVEHYANIVEVAKLFMRSHFRYFPVVEEDRVIGHVGRREVLRALESLRQKDFAK